MFLGIIFGLLAAFFQSLSYLASRQFVQPRATAGEQGAAKRLLILSHVLMGAAALVLLPLIWPYGQTMPWGKVIGPLLFASVYYMFGQIGLMIALRYAAPSRVSPMLAFKLVVLASFATVVPHVGYLPGLSGYDAPVPSAAQWAAVAMAIVGTLVLNYTGGASHPRAALGIILACVGYSLSDWNVGRMVTVMSVINMPVFIRNAVPALFQYVVCGLCALPFLPWLGSRVRKDWTDASPFAATWLLAAIFLYSCFSLAGVVLGNILQSSRGIMSVMLGVLIAHWGHHHLEAKTPRGVLIRRIAATVLMLLAVILYKLAQAKVGT